MGNQVYFSSQPLPVFAFIFGLVIGSFLNVCISRLPKNESIVFPGSKCPVCQNTLKWYHNIPVISFIFLKGRCSFCGTRISPTYPVVEILMGIFTLLLFSKYGPSVNFLIFLAFVAALVVVSFIDLELRIIPNVISLPGIVVGLLVSFIRQDLTFIDSLIGAIAGGGVLMLVVKVYYQIRKSEGMGWGDVKLLAMIGAFLGWRSLPFVILSSSFLGAFIGVVIMFAQKKDLKYAVPFGPFLSLGAVMYIFVGPMLIDWYLGFLRQ